MYDHKINKLITLFIGASFFWFGALFKKDLKYYLSDEFLKRNMFAGRAILISLILVALNMNM